MIDRLVGLLDKFLVELDDPISIVLTVVCVMLVFAIVWMTNCFTKERQYSRESMQELMKNTLVIQDLSNLINRLVLNRSRDKG